MVSVDQIHDVARTFLGDTASPSRVFLCPPYGRAIGKWTEGFVQDYRSDRVTEALVLAPARTDTRWFDLLSENVNCICFIAGRVRFSRQKNGAPFPSAIYYFGDRRDAFVSAFAEFGDIKIPWRIAYALPAPGQD